MPEALVQVTRVWTVPVQFEGSLTDEELVALSELTAGDLVSDEREVLSRDDV